MPIFRNRYLPYFFIAPQIIVTLLFFIWPALTAFRQSFFLQDAFGLKHHFIGLKNYYFLLASGSYWHSILITLLFSAVVAVFTLGLALFIATLVNRVVRFSTGYRVLLILPYAVAPAIAGILWRFLFNPAIGICSYVLSLLGYHWNYLLNGKQAFILICIAAIWQQFSYNFLFFVASLQAIPKSLLEAASIDGANVWQRFWHVIWPLLSPTTFFLLVINVIYAFFDTFGIVQTVTQGGPANATNLVVYKVYSDGFLGMNYGSSAAQSVILMLIVIFLTVLQFRYAEKKVHYQ
ncbi:MAG: sn-glycerol-3-phosphate ABC transporter permease UgpA [Pseudomonadota bacterium]